LGSFNVTDTPLALCYVMQEERKKKKEKEKKRKKERKKKKSIRDEDRTRDLQCVRLA
jgi:hypothetical protein